MSFDIVIPVSGNIIAVITAVVLFSVRYFTFRRKMKKYAGQPAQRRLTPRARQPRQNAEGYGQLEAAKYCDEHIYRFFTAAVTGRGSALGSAANGRMDQRFRGEMTARLRRKAPPTETEGSAQ